MAIKLIVNYSKKLGLPGFSSHLFSVSVETELTTTEDVGREAGRLYQLLQSNVDEQIQNTGFVPPKEYGFDAPEANNTARPESGAPANGSAPNHGGNWRQGPAWKCSDKQRELILKLVEEHQLDKADVEALAVERFGKGVRLLNKVEASGLIDELIDTYSGANHQNGGKRRNGSAYSGANGRRAA